MTVVLFCGGLGLRLGVRGRHLSKPMVPIGGEPILGHLMRYYAHYGHRHFVLCLGYQGDAIVRHFVRSRERISLETGPGATVRVGLRRPDAGPWTVDLVPTGADASIGERLRAVRRYIDQDLFLANYADGLSDLDLPRFLAGFAASGATAGLISVRSQASFHFVTLDGDGMVEAVRSATEADLRVNGGFFAMRREIFDRLAPGEDLVGGLFPRLVREGRLFGYRHDGFWACMDTTKDRLALEAMAARACTPWKIWLTRGDAATERGAAVGRESASASAAS